MIKLKNASGKNRNILLYLLILILASCPSYGQARAAAPAGGEKLAVAKDSAVDDFKMPPGDSAYLEIQEFAESRERAEWFNLAYQKGHALWKVDFAQTLIKYFKDENKYSQKQKHEALTELWLPDDKYAKLSNLVAKLAHEFEGLAVRVSERKAENQISVILNNNKLLRFIKGRPADGTHSTFYSIGQGSASAAPGSNGNNPMWIYSSAKDRAAKNIDLEPEIAKKLAEPISFNVTNRPINEVLEGFLRSAELNCTVSPEVSGNITLYIKDSTVKNVLDTIAANYNLSYTVTAEMIEIKRSDSANMETLIVKLNKSRAQEVNNLLINAKSPAGNIIVDKKSNTLIIKDTPAALETIKKMIETLEKLNGMDQTATRLIALNYADAAKLKTMLTQSLTPEIGAMEVDSRTNTLIITDLESNINKLHAIIKKLDSSRSTSKIIQCKYVSSEDLKTTLNSSLKTVLGSNSETFLIESDKTTNSLLITASAINLEKIESFISELDVRTKQVLIEARIVQVNLARDESMGVNWNRLMQNNANAENSFGFKTFAPIGDDGIGGITYKVGTLSTDQLRLVMQSLQKKDNSKVIASPTIVTTNRKKAYVNVETTYPVRRETVVTTTTGPVTSVTYEKQNVSVRLEVTPAINPDGFVALEVNPKVQGLAGKVDNSQPIVSTKETLTNVVVKNGHTIVIAGLIEEENSNSKTNVPFLGNLPFVSHLFKNQSNTTRKNETIIFITPRIVESGIAENKKL
jgi:type II secretory pathway component GspD/PulD (secretin)